MGNNPLEVYTSTGIKLLHHPDAVKLFKERGLATPISLQVAPTSRCNLKCEFCSNANRDKDEEIDYKSLKKVVKELRKIGLKTVEWTGGGDPTMCSWIDEAIFEFCEVGIEQGFITNGIKFNDLGIHAFFNLKWIRVSLNSLDYVDSITLPTKLINGTLGFSYCWNGSESNLRRAAAFAKQHSGAYLRVVPNCLANQAGLDTQDALLTKLVADIGFPAFYQAKEYHKPSGCLWGWFKPFIDTDSYVYPCSSVVLNSGADRHFHHKYRLCHMTELPDFYASKAPVISPDHCDHCVFWKQNENLMGLLFPNGMENFI